MIKTVIKRDGTRQEFDPSKINAWGKWTAEQHNIKTGEWTEAVQRALIGKGEECTTEALQRSLINELIALNTWGAVMMAGTLEASVLAKRVFPKGMPSVREQFDNMYMLGKMFKMPFTDEEWDQINAMIDHKRDFKLPQFAIKYIAESYAITDVATKSVMETPQFVYMRMACAVASSYPEGQRVDVAFELYDLFSTQVLSAPTPNWTNLGTPENGLASCCLFTADDDRRSLAAANNISYVMTYSSAGLGYHHMVRSIGDPVRKGTIEHQGETGYLKSNAAAAAANKQKKRGGAITAYISAHSREANEIIYGRHPLAPIDKAIRGIDIAVTINDDILSRAIRKQKSLHFTKNSHPELYKAMYSPNHNKRFEAMMSEAVDAASEKDLFDARKTIVTMGTIAITSGRLYSFFVDNANKHTPFLEPIYSSNLCTEIFEPTKPYSCGSELWRIDDDVTGEVALCNLAAINHAKVADKPALHKRAAKAALRMIDYCVHHSHYELPHIGYTAKKRINAGVGVMNTAAYMAKNNLRYNSKEGLTHMHEFAERQSYFLIEASLELGQEKGNAPWIHKTKWAGYTDKDGNHVSAWMPIDTGNKKVAKMFDIQTKMDWEDLRARVAANGGIRNSCLFAIMPGESSSKALGTANAIYPIRDLSLNKTDSTTNIDWMAEGAGDDSYNYQLAFDLTTEETVWFYAVWQRWVDQGISSDFWEDFSKKSTQIDADSILKKYKLMSNFGLKSHYYTVSKTQKSAEQMMKEDMEMRAAIGDINITGDEKRGGPDTIIPDKGMTAMDASDFSAAVCGIDDKGGCTL